MHPSKFQLVPLSPSRPALKRVFVLRHAKSDWSADFPHDRQRPLAKRGRAAARTIGKLLERLGEVPDLVLASPAVRAAETARLAGEAGGWQRRIEIADELYERSPETVLGLVRRQSDESSKLLLASHEPTCSELISLLVGGAEVNVPTAAVTRIDFPVESWREVEFGRGILHWQVTPKLLRRVGFDLDKG